jgi:hypothetical protein
MLRDQILIARYHGSSLNCLETSCIRHDLLCWTPGGSSCLKDPRVPSRSRCQLGLWIHGLLLLHVILLYVSLGRLIEVLKAICAQPRLILNLFLGKRRVGLGPIVGILL